MSELFSAFGINWKLLVVQALNFALLLAILWRFLYQPVLKMIDDRRRRIAEGVREAEAATRRLAEADTEGKQIVGEAAREAEKLVASARVRAEEKAAEVVAGAETEALALIKDAQARADEAKRHAQKESEREIARVAMLAAEKILREKA